jgi:F-type H+-transporting ATPase subunit b
MEIFQPHGLLGDAKIWIAIGIGVFLLLVQRMGGFKAIADGLDARGQRIANELSEAERLRAEAEALLAKAKARQAAAEEEAKGIVAQAKSDADALRVEAKRELEADLKRREALTEERIQRAEAKAQADVRSAAADAAIEAAERLLKTNLTPDRQAALVAEGARELARRFG